MRIVVNKMRREDLEQRFAGTAPSELVQSLGAEFFRSGELVIRVLVDSVDLTGQDRGNWVGLADAQELELETQTPRALLAGSLKVSREWLPPLRAELSICADQFRLGEDAQAIDSLLKVVEGLRLLFMGVGQIHRLAAGQDVTQSAELPLELVGDFQADIPRLLDEIIQAQEGRDWILLADLLEYDVMERLQRWEETVDMLLKALA